MTVAPPQRTGRSIWVRLARGLRAHPSRNPTFNITMWSALAVIWLLIIVAAAIGQSPKHSTAASAVPGASTLQPVTAVATTAVTPMQVTPTSPIATTPSPTPTAGPKDTTGGITVNGAGAVLPDPARTPGAINPAVTQANINQTICVTGWTATVRPPSSYTTALKERQLASGYSLHGDMNTGDYEEDHLISLEIGGAPASVLNLWPEPYNVPDGARVKDVVENKLHALVCAGSMSLVTAQHAIATNWWTAYVTYVGAPPAGLPASPPTTSTPAPPVTNLTCSASMSNPSPAQYSTTDVIVHTAAGASVTATANYNTTTTSHTGTAGSNDIADIAFRLSRATIGYTVRVDVMVSLRGVSRSCSTSFTPA